MTSHKEVSISCQEPLPKNSVSIMDCRFSSLSLVWLCRLIRGDEMWHEFTYLHATPGRKFQSCQANATIMKSCTHAFLTAVSIVFLSLQLPLSRDWVCHSLLCFLGGGFFFGVLLHDIYLVMERWEGGVLVKWPWYMFVHIGEPNIVLYECARHITVVRLLIGRFLGGLSYLGVIKIKILSLFIIIYWHLENPY